MSQIDAADTIPADPDLTESVKAENADNGTTNDANGQPKPTENTKELENNNEAKRKHESIQPNAEEQSNFFFRLLFMWLQPLFTRAAALHKEGKALQEGDLTPLAAQDHGSSIEERFENVWNTWKAGKEYKTPQAELESRVLASLLGVCKHRMIAAGILKFFNTGLQFTFPLVLQAILKFLEESQANTLPSSEKYKGYWLSALLGIFIASKAMTESRYFHMVNRCSWQVKTAVSASVYRKSLRLAARSQHSTTLGELVNLMQVDASKMELMVPQTHVLWDGAFQSTGYMIILGTLIGWPCIMGLVVMLCAGPVMGIVMGKLFGMNRAMVKYTDARVQTVNEALQGIRCVKLYTWESSFAEKIAKSRDQELEHLRTMTYLRGFSRAYMTALPTLAAVATFLVYAYATDEVPSASTLFASLVTFDQLRFPLLFYPMALAQLAQAKVSLGRVAIFLGLEEVTTGDGLYNREHEFGGGNGSVEVENSTIYWSDPEKPISRAETEDKSLDKTQRSTKSESKADNVDNGAEEDLVYPKPVVCDLTWSVKPGYLSAIIGRVGSGKSSLVSALLNETVLAKGSSVTVNGRVAYAAQVPWILNQTVRDNILFGRPYDEKRYQRVLQVCQLTHDLSLFDDGDRTEIGERGINLSGGQKQRISVARAAYADAELVILDDPLSALDPEVAEKVLEECILGFMKGKTRILVTNYLQCLPQCDTILALGKNGEVLEHGSYSELMKDENGEVQRLITELAQLGTKDDEDQNDSEVKGDVQKSGLRKSAKKQETEQQVSAKNGKKDPPKALTTQEEREVGAVKFSIYLKYMSAGGGFTRFAWVYVFFLLSTGAGIMVTVWVALWSRDPFYKKQTQEFYLFGYAGTAILLGIVTYIRSFQLARFGVKASAELHDRLTTSVLKAPMSFFDTTPTGRILSRFSKDIYTIDLELVDSFDFVLLGFLQVMATMGMITFATPWFGLAFFPLAFVYLKILNYFRDVSRETKRLESLSRSPVYAHFSETLGGLSTIRAYNETSTFIEEFETKLDGNTKAIYNNKTADRWLSVRLELIGAAIALLAALFACNVVVLGGATGSSRTGFAAVAGMALTYSIQITGVLQWSVRSFAQVEAAMNSCERVLHYVEHIPHEAGKTSTELSDEVSAAQSGSSRNNSPDDNSQTHSTASIIAVRAMGQTAPMASDWPAQGAIELNNLTMRYRAETPLVLKGLTVSIRAGERVGVVGRTGSGKSSLLLSLMRIVEPEVNKGTYTAPISIDGVDVLRIGLDELRTKIGIIPQNPVLFSGTIRSNMDPFENYTDEEIWSALGQCGMKDSVETMPDLLQAHVAEYGDNLSQGQRQLLCMGRALLKKCRVLLLDEATSSVDIETDRDIQKTIREAFVGCTVLTIAHRINTIMDSDKILVMSDGLAAEFGSPNELLKNDRSLFYDIVQHSKAEQQNNDEM